MLHPSKPSTITSTRSGPSCQSAAARSHGKAVAFTLGRHVHPKARTDNDPEQVSAGPSGIDYLKLLDDAHTQQLESRINYTALFNDTDDHDGDPGLFSAEVVTR